MRLDGYLRDVAAAPERLAALSDAYADGGGRLADVPRATRVVLSGMGSSRFAALPAAAALRAHGVAAVAELASTTLPTRPAPGTLAVGISASGSTPETVEALARHVETSTTVAITNDPDGELARLADVTLPLHAGVEEGGVSCLTFQATLALLQLLVSRLGAPGAEIDDVRRAVETAAALRASAASWLPAVADRVDQAPGTFLIAPDARSSTALQGALMLREGPRVPADGTETGDWLHVDVYLTRRPGYTALLFTGSPYDEAVLGWARERGSAIVAVGDLLEDAVAHVALPADPLQRLLTETAVAELVAGEVWARRVAAGDAAVV